MPLHELACATCDADIPLVGDERVGDEVYCAFCGAPGKIKGADDGVLEIEDDY